MQDLIQTAIFAHGGLDRWNGVGRISATAKFGGPALEQRTPVFTSQPTRVSVETHRQRTTFEPFMAPDLRGIFEPRRTAVEDHEGTLVEELTDPRTSFDDWMPGMAWTPTQTAYFAGYALWSYLNLPFLLARDGFICDEVEPLSDEGEVWRALRVVFPAGYATHAAEQTLYFDEAGLVRRHDYIVEISGNVPVAHYCYGHRAFDGIVFPTRRRVFLCGSDRTAQKQAAIITAELGDFVVSSGA